MTWSAIGRGWINVYLLLSVRAMHGTRNGVGGVGRAESNAAFIPLIGYRMSVRPALSTTSLYHSLKSSAFVTMEGRAMGATAKWLSLGGTANGTSLRTS